MNDLLARISGCMVVISDMKKSIQHFVGELESISELEQLIGEGGIPNNRRVTASQIVEGYDADAEQAFAHLQAAKERLVEARAHAEVASNAWASIGKKESQAKALISTLKEGDNK